MVKSKGHSVENTGAYERLANAVILTACRDYRQALQRLSRNKNNRDALVEKESIERFFKSGWFSVLTSIDPEKLVRRLQEEFEA